jgi:TRAP-type mannitol/chloroaromatic compound transport system permease small subunit
MRTAVKTIESISEWSGKVMRWACVVLILVLCFEVTARYVFDAPTMWAYEVGTMLGTTIVAMGWAYTHWRHGHVRIDIFYARLSPRGKALIDVICSLVLFFPLLIILMYNATDHVWFAWTKGETLGESYWYPPAFPIRTVLLLGLMLFFLQGIAQFIRDLFVLLRKELL